MEKPAATTVPRAVLFDAYGTLFDVYSVALLAEQTVDHVVIKAAVSDGGIGISPEKAAQVFEPFAQADTTTSRRYGGTGLGLTISRDLAHLLGFASA